ncbi:sensor histidine kinase [Hymenobacter tibetensis]|uniref:Sensor histidine kinase n=1 Tax=Hymenobacter tibetensis TaxID=497967 RepID=A0ABY4CVS4_9BACT|nr:sensor histidine kinase [Hymenobacter tibetensis]UOG74375.1 sensor histidine kinase [Hymenobacter tibetensis]
MELSAAPVIGSTLQDSVVARPTWWQRLRRLLQPTGSTADLHLGRIPWLIHVLLWLWLLTLDVMKLANNIRLLPRFPHTATEWQPLLPLLGRQLLEDIFGATLFYLTWQWLVPRTLGRARIGQYVLLAAMLIIPYAAIVGTFTVQFANKGVKIQAYKVTRQVAGKKKPVTTIVDPQKRGLEGPLLWGVVLGSLFIGTVVVGSSTALRITNDYLRQQRNRREQERQQLLTELAMLKTQINPHFLFNTLNNIYSLTSRKSDKAPEAVLRLAEIMRYLLYESSTDTVPLSREIQHLNSFLDLQRLRLSASAQDAIRFEVTGAAPDSAHPVAPLLLLPLVENAFKHGDLTARPVAVHISLNLTTEGLLRFSVLNYVAPADAERELPVQPGGVGLVNLRRRLELLYPGRYTLHVETLPAQHLVTLVLLR